MRKCPAVRLNVKESRLLIGYCNFSPTTIDRQNKNYESRFTNIVILYLKYIKSRESHQRSPESTKKIQPIRFERKNLEFFEFRRKLEQLPQNRIGQPDLRLDPTHSRNQNQIQNETVSTLNIT